MVKRQALEAYLNTLLNVAKFRDYAPNGLQVEGCEDIRRLVTGVTASQALLNAALEWKADAILVHHGYFWKSEAATVVGMKKQRLATLLTNDISLFAYHLPLDAHAEFGNNSQLAKHLGFIVDAYMDERELQGVGLVGHLPEPMSLASLGQHIAKLLEREPMLIAGGEHLISRIAWCTGGAQSYIDHAASLRVDAYLSGELSEPTTHSARENGIHYVAAGHHATERYGVKALGEHLAEQFDLECQFVDVNNPA